MPEHARSPRRHAVTAMLLALVWGLLAPFGGPTVAHAASPVLAVDSTEDAVDANPGDGICATAVGACSLRAAVMEADALDATPDAPVTIMLPAGTYTLTLPPTPIKVGSDPVPRGYRDDADRGDLNLTVSVTIIGAGMGTTIIDGGKVDRIFRVANKAKVSIGGVTLQNGRVASALMTGDEFAGRGGVGGGGISVETGSTLGLADSVVRTGSAFAGGGIANSGTATLTRVTIAQNVAPDDRSNHASGGGIDNSGTLTLIACSITGNATGSFGGGINNRGTLTMDTSTIAGNQARVGGGLENDGGTATGQSGRGALIVTASTISGNTASERGGGIDNRSGGTVSLTTSTISGNAVTNGPGGGLDSVGAVAILTNVTVSGNTASNLPGRDGVNADGGVMLRNSLIADGCAGAVTSGDYNLDAGNRCGFTGAHDRQNADPKLGPLANNGGPTLTHALQTGSAAVDTGGTGANGCPGTDQRGVARPQGGACDIGAFELEQPGLPTTPAGGTMACTPLAPGSPFASPGFQSQWRQGEVLAPNFWGPADSVGVQEPYGEAPGGQRLVQYFDKGRMELTNPSTGIVTNGLLATELITGMVQVGDASFQAHTAANIPVAGDPDNAGPTYAQLETTAKALFAPATPNLRATVTTTLDATGAIIPGGNAVNAATIIATFDTVTQHNVPGAFAAYREMVGVLTIGYAKSEPFLATVKVAGTERRVMVQVFERRVLTYTADNPEPYKVEMGNIGQHYARWRYCGG